MIEYTRLSGTNTHKLIQLMWGEEKQKYFNFLARLNNIQPINIDELPPETMENLESAWYAGCPGAFYNLALNVLQLEEAKRLDPYKYEVRNEQ